MLQGKILESLAPNKAVLIFGARRVGKTVMMRQIVDSYSGRTMMLNGEDFDTLDLLQNRSVANYRHLLNGIDLLAIDEAQNVPQIGSVLKLIVDEVPGISVLASGSSSFDLLNKTGEPLVGRSTQFLLTPFSQREIAQRETVFETRQNFESRLIYGSYPEVVMMDSYERKMDYLRDIVGAYLVGVLFADGNINLIFWIFAVVGALLTAVTFGAINDRGFKTVKKSLIVGGCSVVCLAVTALTLWSGFFGYSTRIPSAERVKSASVSFGGSNVEFADPKLVFKLHSEIAENGAEAEEYEYISVSYELKNGGSFKRAFNVDLGDYIDTLLEIYKSDENKESIRKRFDSFTENNLAISVYSDEDSVEGLYLTPAELTRLKEAYLNDISGATEVSITGGLYYTVDISGFDKDYDYLRESFYVEDGFKNTIEVINALDLKARAESVGK